MCISFFLFHKLKILVNVSQITSRYKILESMAPYKGALITVRNYDITKFYFLID